MSRKIVGPEEENWFLISYKLLCFISFYNLNIWNTNSPVVSHEIKLNNIIHTFAAERCIRYLKYITVPWLQKNYNHPLKSATFHQRLNYTKWSKFGIHFPDGNPRYEVQHDETVFIKHFEIAFRALPNESLITVQGIQVTTMV